MGTIALVLILVLCDLHAALRRPHRRAWRERSCRRATGRPRTTPLRVHARGLGLRPRPDPLQPDHGNERRLRGCGSSASRGSSPTARPTPCSSASSSGSWSSSRTSGPVLGAIPPILVALFDRDPLTAVWVVILFVALQQLEGHIVAPAVLFGKTLRVNPLLVIFALAARGRSCTGSSARCSRCPSPRSGARPSPTCAATSCLEPWGEDADGKAAAIAAEGRSRRRRPSPGAPGDPESPKVVTARHP